MNFTPEFCRCSRRQNSTTRGDTGIRRRGSFVLSKNYLDDVFALTYLLGLEKNIAKNSTLTENLIFLDSFLDEKANRE